MRGYDFVRDNTLPYDRNGHGTFVAGVIAQSTNNGIGLTGVAYRSRIMPVRVLDYEGKGDVATIARGIRLAARRGAQVINMSFEFDIGLTSSEIPDVLSAVRYAHRKGAVMVPRPGNTEETRIAYPARARQVIAVGATTEHGCVADYSNSGPGSTWSRRAAAPTRSSTPTRTASRWRTRAATSTSTPSAARARASSACRAATRARRWRCRT